MKRLLLFCTLCLVVTTALAQKIKVDGIVYKLDEEDLTATLIFVDTNLQGAVTLPEKVTKEDIDYTVTRIGDKAFMQLYKLTALTLPPRLTHIGAFAFQDCAALTIVRIPQGVTHIGASAFTACPNLREIFAFPAIAPQIATQQSPFDNTTHHITTLIVPKGSRNNYAAAPVWKSFSLIIEADEQSLVQIDGIRYQLNAEERTARVIRHPYTGAIRVPAQVVSATQTYRVVGISGGAFYRCSSLSTVALPTGLSRIGGNAFTDCKQLTTMVLPDSLKSIEEETFKGCVKLQQVTLPDRLTSIATRAFSGCQQLTALHLPNSVTHIGANAFEHCHFLSHIQFSSDLQHILPYTFFSNSLRSLSLPPSLKTIGDAAFSRSSRLTALHLPDSLSVIGRQAFSECPQLATVSLPASLTSLGEWAFFNCPLLKEIKVGHITPLDLFLDEEPFTAENYQTATLIVPKGSLMAYRTAEGWKEFQQIRESDEVASVSSVTTHKLHRTAPCYSLDGKCLPKALSPTTARAKGIYLQGGKKWLVQ